MGLLTAACRFELLLAVGLLQACGEAPEPGLGREPQDPAAAFSALEERLLSAQAVEVDYEVAAEGAVEVDLQGGLRIEAGGLVEITARGRFAGQEVDLLLRSEGGQYEYGNGPDRRAGPTPRYLNEAVLIGLTRMGILHNLAMLVGNAPPDGAEGGVRDWVVVEDFSFDQDEPGQGSSQVISFSMVVGGAPAGAAALEVGSKGVPVLREQTVQFPDGEMRVVERYTRVLISP
ncbi:MAG: hypothetical protein PVJ76_21455 [Gemmatimonadota bacterium]